MKGFCVIICLLNILPSFQIPVTGKDDLASSDDDSSSKEHKLGLQRDSLFSSNSAEKKDEEELKHLFENLESLEKQEQKWVGNKFDWTSDHMVNFWEKSKEQRKYTKWLNDFLERNQCGMQIIAPVWPNFRIIGGRSIIPGSWPWMASLLFDLIGHHWCAGTLISDEWLVTARHCFDPPFNDTRHWSVRLGKFDLSKEEEEEQTFTVKKLIGHPRYNPVIFDNDVALIQLDRPVTVSEFISPICLGSRIPASDSEECIITGWGKTNENNTQLSTVMEQVEVPLMKQSDCIELYPGKVTRNMLCAGLYRGGQDACAGDSGGPLQCQQGDIWYMQGITSWGGNTYVECGHPLQPGVYTRVSHYKNWIYKQIYHSQADANEK